MEAIGDPPALKCGLHTEDPTSVTTAAGILNHRDVAFNGSSLIALPVAASRCVERVICFQSEHPIIKPDFLNK